MSTVLDKVWYDVQFFPRIIERILSNHCTKSILHILLNYRRLFYTPKRPASRGAHRFQREDMLQTGCALLNQRMARIMANIRDLNREVTICRTGM